VKNELALVVGATSSIGAAIAETLLRSGAEVWLHGRDPARLDALATRLSSCGTCRPVVADLTRQGDVTRLRDLVSVRARLDVLSMGAGIYERSDETEALARQLAANVRGPYSLLVGLIPQLIAARGQVVFLNSTQGLSASKGLAQYAATQHALRAIADSVRDEVNPHGVRVLSIFLGRTATERQRAIFESEGRTYQPERLIQPEDVAHTVLAALTLPRTAEITNIMLRPMLKHDT
jgi:NADP-dependent 3-hydroxy acid dehydrogenase YdfG